MRKVFFPSSLLFFPHSIIENVSRVAGGLAYFVGRYGEQWPTSDVTSGTIPNNNDRQVLDVDDYPGK